MGRSPHQRTQSGTEVPLLDRAASCKPASMNPISFAPVHRLRRLIVATGLRCFPGGIESCNIVRLIRPLALTVMAFISFATSALAQEVTIPDSGLNAAIRDALNKPVGPLTEQDLLGLTNLNASSRNISNIVGLDAARNLVSLSLQINRLTTFSLPTSLTNLLVLDLNSNSLSNCSFPPGPIRLNSLDLSHNLIA